jgi:pyrroline-5-carboxylate reductase
MAGISLKTLGRMIGPAREVARAIPLISVSNGNGVTPVHPPSPTARLLFDRLGGTVEIADELAFEAFAATMATIAAQYGHLGAISRWLAAKGVPERDARRHVAATFCGVAAGLQSDDPDFVRLAREYATPGGVNEQFLADLDAAGSFETVHLALDRVFARLTQPCTIDASAQR